MKFYTFIPLFFILFTTICWVTPQKIVLTRDDKDFLLQQLPIGHKMSHSMQVLLNQSESGFPDDERCKRQFMLLQQQTNPLQTLQMNIPFVQPTINPAYVLVAPAVISAPVAEENYLANSAHLVPKHNVREVAPSLTVRSETTQADVILEDSLGEMTTSLSFRPEQNQALIIRDGNLEDMTTLNTFKPDPVLRYLETTPGYNFDISEIVNKAASKAFDYRSFLAGVDSRTTEYKRFSFGLDPLEIHPRKMVSVNPDLMLSEFRLRKFLETTPERLMEQDFKLTTKNLFDTNDPNTISTAPALQPPFNINQVAESTTQNIQRAITSRSVENAQVTQDKIPLSRSKLELSLYNQTFCDNEITKDIQEKVDRQLNPTLNTNHSGYIPNTTFSDKSDLITLITQLDHVTTPVNTILPGKSEELLAAQDAKIEQKLLSILDDVEAINTNKPTVNEGMPCSHKGKWESSMAGIGFNIEKSEGENFKVPVFTITMGDGFLKACDWDVVATVPSFSASMLMLTATHTQDFHMATFTGECRTCNNVDEITGHWLIVKAANTCEEMNKSQEFFGDTWKRHNV